jgi:HEPN domain-containing protein
LDLISQKDVIEDEIYDLAEKLEQFAVELRYPDITIKPSIVETHELINIAEQIITHIQNRLLRLSL